MSLQAIDVWLQGTQGTNQPNQAPGPPWAAQLPPSLQRRVPRGHVFAATATGLHLHLHLRLLLLLQPVSRSVSLETANLVALFQHPWAAPSHHHGPYLHLDTAGIVKLDSKLHSRSARSPRPTRACLPPDRLHRLHRLHRLEPTPGSTHDLVPKLTASSCNIRSRHLKPIRGQLE